MDSKTKCTFALFFGNRGFFPASLLAGARKELPDVLHKAGYGHLIMDESATRYGAVETPEEGAGYARFLRDHAGEYDGVILSLPNFGDETGAVAALKDAGVPIMIQAYPDEMDKMGPALRRDAFCGKLSVMDVFHQYGVKFTALAPHTVSPSAEVFGDHLDYFHRVCSVVGAMKDVVIGAVGARTTPFKTVRIDELALQRKGITVETFDLSDLFARARAVDQAAPPYRHKADVLRQLAAWEGVPDKALDNLVRLGVVLDTLVEECHLNALALRCWLEMQQQLGISPCVLISEMNERGIPVACEVDIGNAVAMHALSAASGCATACLDWNNNYRDEENKCILFHCGSVPRSLMTGKGAIVEHAILRNALGDGCGYGCNNGRIAPTPMTFSSLATEAGVLKSYVGEGRFTKDALPDDFFGCAAVAEIAGLQDVLHHVGMEGHRHHVSVTPGHVMKPLQEALGYYLEWRVAAPQQESRPV